jgi:hypothetical protein
MNRIGKYWDSLNVGLYLHDSNVLEIEDSTRFRLLQSAVGCI